MKFPPRIQPNELKKGGEYQIVEVHEKSVVLRIHDDMVNIRSFFLPEKHANKFRNHFVNAEDVDCYELYLKFDGFQDTVKQINPMMEIIYKGEAQHA